MAVDFGDAYKWFENNTTDGVTKYDITRVDFVTAYTPTGAETDSWDASAAKDGSITCYRTRNAVTVVLPEVMTAIPMDMFLGWSALETITGLGAVTTIGDFAFNKTESLKDVDLNASKIVSIGDRACFMSNIEDVVDLSGVPLDKVGPMATRRKRWSAEGLASIQSNKLGKDILYAVPNSDNQNLYDDIPYRKDLVKGGYKSAKDSGCASFTLYHIWNFLYAGTDKAYTNWLDWFNATLNKNGDFAEKDYFHSPDYYAHMVSELGWTLCHIEGIDTPPDKSIIFDSLNRGYPIYIGTMGNQIGNLDSAHAVLVVGYDKDTDKFAILNSVNGNENSAALTWYAFEDFSSEYYGMDNVKIIAYSKPVLAPSTKDDTTWFTQGGAGVDKEAITEIEIKGHHVISSATTANWDASAAKDGSVWAYVEGTKLILAGNGMGCVYANPNGIGVFKGFTAMTTFTGAATFNTEDATTLERAFYDCSSVERLDLTSWNTAKVKSLYSTFNGMLALKELLVSGWNTGTVESMRATFQCCVVLEELDLSGWTTSNVTTLQGFVSSFNDYGGPMSLKKIIGIENWDVSKVTNATSVFERCHNLVVDVGKWKFAPTVANGMFHDCQAITELDLSGFDTTGCTNLSQMLDDMYGLKKITVGENFSFVGNGASTTKTAVLPTPANEDGCWYTADGTAYAPTDIPAQMATTYVTDKAIWNEMYFIRYGTLQQLADATRKVTGTNKQYNALEMAEALRSL